MLKTAHCKTLNIISSRSGVAGASGGAETGGDAMAGAVTQGASGNAQVGGAFCAGFAISIT